MKTVISFLAVMVLAIIASPLAMGLILLLLGAGLGTVIGVVGIVALIVSWLVPIFLCLIVLGLIAWIAGSILD